MLREIGGAAAQPTPPGIWPATPAPAPRVEPPAAPRKPPVAVGTLPPGTTVIRPVRFEGDEKNKT